MSSGPNAVAKPRNTPATAILQRFVLISTLSKSVQGQGVFIGLEVTPKGLQKIRGCGQAAKTVFSEQSSQQPENTNWLLSLSSCLRYPFWNRLEDTFEPFR